MKITIRVKLLPDENQRQILLNTMQVFNEACNVISEIAFQEKCYSRFKLQKMIYHEIKAQFSLSAQITILAIRKVVDSYKMDRKKVHQFRPTGCVLYDLRVLSFSSLTTANLWTTQGRIKIPIHLAGYQKARWDFPKGQAALVLHQGEFFLLIAVETPEQPPQDPTDYIGVDLGIVNIATDSDGDTYSGEQVEKTCSCYHRMCHNLQKKGTQSAKCHLRKLKRKEKSFRKHEHHVIAKKLVEKAKDTGPAIVLEDLKSIRSSTTVQKSQQARHSGWSFHQLRKSITYKAKLWGVKVLTFVDVEGGIRQDLLSICN